MRTSSTFFVQASARREFLDPAAIDEDILDVFVVEDPEKLDLVHICGTDPSIRGAILRRERQESDVEGCIALVNGQPIEPGVPLGSPRIPILSLLDALEHNGFEPEQHVVTHSNGGRKAYDARDPMGKRAYYQCVIAGSQLFQKGAQPYKSNRPQAFYKLLLRDQAKAEAKLKAIECEKLVWAAERSVKLDALEARAPKRPRVELPVVPGEDVQVEEEEEVFVGGREEVPAPLAPPSPAVAPLAPPSPAGSSSSSSPSSSREEEEVYAGPRPVVPPYPEMIRGVQVRPRFKTNTNKWGIEVTCPHHDNCRKFRTLDLNTDIFGHRAAEYFLGAWLMTPNPPNGKPHKRWFPARNDVREYKDMVAAVAE